MNVRLQPLKRKQVKENYIMWQDQTKQMTSMINVERQIAADYNKRGIDCALSYITQQANNHQLLVSAQDARLDQMNSNIIERRLLLLSQDEFYSLKVVDEDESSVEEEVI